MMRTVQLYTRDGAFLIAGRVPRFIEGHEAEILHYGTRMFLIDRAASPPTGPLHYRECFGLGLVDVDLTLEPA